MCKYKQTNINIFLSFYQATTYVDVEDRQITISSPCMHNQQEAAGDKACKTEETILFNVIIEKI